MQISLKKPKPAINLSRLSGRVIKEFLVNLLFNITHKFSKLNPKNNISYPFIKLNNWFQPNKSF